MMLAPLPPDYWSAEAAAHLALRAGFGQTPDESKKWAEQGLEAMLNHLLQSPADNVAPPDWAYPTRDEDLLQRVRNPALTPEEKAQVQRDLNIRKAEHMADLVNWWTLRMSRSPAPFVEKMTLFWHGHFATSAEKVSAYRMWLQNETIRRYALSNFGTLVKAISCDPAMINWLDLGSSQKEHPNENFARELMELFTLGEGHYTEDDVKAAARAFTGYRVAGPAEQFRFVAGQFDQSDKTFLGKTGPWRGDQVIDLILSQPQCAKFIATKIWRFFAYDDPAPPLIDVLGGQLLRCKYELKPFMKIVLSSQEFFSPQAHSTIIKSPVQFLVQGQKTLGLPLPTGQPLVFIYRQLGQIPFYPPNVKGWDGGKSWINTATLTYRYELARELVYGVLPEQVGLPKGPAPSPTPSPTPAVTKPLAMEASMEEMAVKAMNADPQSMSLIADQNIPGPAKAVGNTGTPAPQKRPEPQVVPPPAPTPLARLTAGLPIGKFVSPDDRKDPRRVVEKLSLAIFQATPDTALLEKFVNVATANPVPFDDHAIRELATLMMTTPIYQLC
ncbi:MAG: DUF1800 domain-containing protein [Chthoniobacterales bacterium]